MKETWTQGHGLLCEIGGHLAWRQRRSLREGCRMDLVSCRDAIQVLHLQLEQVPSLSNDLIALDDECPVCTASDKARHSS